LASGFNRAPSLFRSLPSDSRLKASQMTVLEPLTQEMVTVASEPSAL